MSGKNINMLFLDGQIVKANRMLLEMLTPGISERKGVFETMKVCGERILFLQEHFVRMQRGLHLYDIKQPYSLKKIEKYLYQIIQKNSLKNARIRLSIWRQGSKRCHMAIAAQSVPTISKIQYQKGIAAIVSSIPRLKTRFSHIKSLDYQIFRKALIEAKAKGYEEAILLNTQGEIVEGATSNIFFIHKCVLYTPAVRCGCLNGITRYFVLQCAKKLKIPFRVVCVNKKQLFDAEEVFLTNSLFGIMPLTRVDNQKIGSQRMGKITEKLLNGYQKLQISGCPIGLDCI